MANTSVNDILQIRQGTARNSSGNAYFAAPSFPSLASGTFSVVNSPTFGTGSGTICSMATTGALQLPIIGSSTSDIYMVGAKSSHTINFMSRVEDILWGRGSLTLTATGTTTITGSTITRHTGTGGMLWLQCTTAPTGSATTPAIITISYTNQAGTSGRTARTYDVSSASAERVTSGLNVAGRKQVVTLQQGDTGVLSVESITVTQAVVGWSGGAWALVITKPLSVFRNSAMCNQKRGIDDFLHTGIIKIHNGSSSANTTPCISYTAHIVSTVTTVTSLFVLKTMLVNE